MMKYSSATEIKDADLYWDTISQETGKAHIK